MDKKEILEKAYEIKKNADYYSPYGASEAIDELISLIKKLIGKD